jgi:hypothetical protein
MRKRIKNFGFDGGRNIASSVRQIKDGEYIIAGTENILGNENMFLLKIDADGNDIWWRSHGGAGMKGASAVRKTNDGNYIHISCV